MQIILFKDFSSIYWDSEEKKMVGCTLEEQVRIIKTKCSFEDFEEECVGLIADFKEHEEQFPHVIPALQEFLEIIGKEYVNVAPYTPADISSLKGDIREWCINYHIYE